ncbi:MAG: sulfite exporter TauE/SafE family protein [Planctomycetota bacterium]
MDPSPTLLLVSCTACGMLAALLGLGGGLFVVPLLNLGFGIDMPQAIAVSLLCCVATSAAGSVALDKARLADLRTVILVEVAASPVAMFATGLAMLAPQALLRGCFALLVAFSAWRILLRELRARAAQAPAEPPTWDPQGDGDPPWPRRPRLGLVLGGLTGFCSALGIGGGPVKVPLMTEVLGVPMRVALASSNVMVGLSTACAATVSYASGSLRADLAAPCALGMAVGAYAGGRVAPRIDARWLSLAFVAVLVYMGGKMAWLALHG